MATTNSATVSLKLLIDTKSNKVLFAEASKEVVDFLFTLLSLHVATVTRLLLSNGVPTMTRIRLNCSTSANCKRHISDSPVTTCPTCISLKISTQVFYVAPPPEPTGVTSGNIKSGYVKSDIMYMIMMIWK
ncbi:unnamed protein product [Prunus armeniaca]